MAKSKAGDGDGGGGGKGPIDESAKRTVEEVNDAILLMNVALEDQKKTSEALAQIYSEQLETKKKELVELGLSLDSSTARLELQKEASQLAFKDLALKKEQLAEDRKSEKISKSAYELQLKDLQLKEKSLKVTEEQLGVERKLSKTQEFKAQIGEKIWSSLQNQVATIKSLGSSMNDMKADLNEAAGGAYDLEGAFQSMGTMFEDFGASEAWSGQKATLVALSSEMGNLDSVMREGALPALAQQAGMLKRLGVDAASTGKLAQEAMQQWGMSAQGAMDVQLGLAAAAKQSGIPVGKMMKEFATALPKLEKHGKGAVKEFKRLQVIAKKTGINIDTLMGSMSKFDTIDGAAEAAANLNSVLGLNINAMDMLNMTESQRAMHIKDQLALSGKQLSNMNRMEKMAAAEAMGMSVGEFSKMMNAKGKLSEADLQAAEKATMAQGELQEMSAKAIKQSEVDEKKKQAAIGNSKELASAVGELTRGMDRLMIGASIAGPVIAGVFSLGLAIVMARAKQAFLGMFKVVGEGSDVVADAGPKVKSFMQDTAKGVKSLGNAASSGAKGILAFGAAFLMMGTAVAIAALGVAELVKSFSGFDATEILAIAVALAVFGAMMVGLGYMLVLAAPAIAGAALPLLAFGAAMLMMGGAVALAAVGLSMATPALLELIKGLAPHALEMLAIGFALPLIGIGFAAMAVGVGLLAVALKFISTKDLIAISQMALGFSGFAKNITSEFTMAMKAIADFVDAVDDIGKSDVEVFQMLRKEVVTLLSSPVTPGIGAEMMGVSRAAMEYAKANARLKISADDDAFVGLVNALKGAIGSVSGGSGGSGGAGNTIVLNLDGREFARAVGAAIDSRHDVRMS